MKTGCSRMVTKRGVPSRQVALFTHLFTEINLLSMCTLLRISLKTKLEVGSNTMCTSYRIYICTCHQIIYVGYHFMSSRASHIMSLSSKTLGIIFHLWLVCGLPTLVQNCIQKLIPPYIHNGRHLNT